MLQFKLVALGGTFDIIHKGHIALLQKGFSISSKVIIGLTSDELAAKKSKNLIHNYSQRLGQLQSAIKRHFPKTHYEISKLEDDFGPAILKGDVEALVVSEETIGKGDVLNKLRAQKNLGPVKIITVPMVLAKDGKRISATRIKQSEIDPNGNVL